MHARARGEKEQNLQVDSYSNHTVLRVPFHRVGTAAGLKTKMKCTVVTLLQTQ